MRVNVLGIGFDNLSLEQSATLAFDKITSKEKTYAVTPNPEIVWLSRRNEALRSAINSAGLVLPDGIGVIYGAKILGTPLSHGRVPGIDFAAALFCKMAKAGLSVFLMGAKPGVAATAGENLAKTYPGLIIAGTADGYFTDSAPIIEKINSSRPDLLLVCLGAPKQELWMAENLEKLDVPLCAGLGGSLDVFAGNVKRAPVFFQKAGLEWLYRIFKEPKRLARSVSLPLFILRVIVKRITNA
ncbi:MAG: WecB/TagA/CpsF family glycosyltransferase [Oscillospiraceae bacterium]|nr:WecB/TagA/CpsF family glycosyltransferase [Oscillospiraceae bacterium]